MLAMTSRRVARLSVMIMLVALATGGCGGGDTPSSDTQPTGAQTNPSSSDTDRGPAS
jgi:hypothetical protein